ncbi:cysteine desulfurase [Tissierella praeacuta DSM 18095]|uniref:Cysteine desulfurase n=1 Tax=Tissierella praeacuta DSM 18095 TaxID=1123404 RepID=A0A1M4ZJZ2_9FIRM|nr:cysteine desulfurase family protein [Tissierella praeacuta]SHF18334.1 cysteine desulfurase [Tissierella praeacuta DSM 18095]SUP00676.1 Cysteine desulfurase [Tissierella praeacuta]
MIYLDNCSTTKPRKEVINIVSESMEKDFGNPSSLHRLGMKSEKKIKEAREYIAKYLNVDNNEIYFTSGGTESNNIAIQSIVNKFGKRGKHIITTKIEHSSVLNIMRNYEIQGFDITYLNVDSLGYISLEELKNSIRKDTILVSVMHVNNEIGAIQPIAEIKKIINSVNPSTLLHVDGVQGFGKVGLSLKVWGIDSYSFSGHKVYGPKGVGGLFIDKKHVLSPIVFGGNQEKGLRSGTENLTGIIGFGEAVRIMTKNFESESKYAFKLKEYLANRVKEEIQDIRFNTSLDESSSPYILNISFNHVRGEVLLHCLEDKDIYVSTSSACSSKGTEKSHVLKSICLKNEEIEGAIRFCFSYENTIEDIEYTVQILKESVSEIRQITMR